MRTHNALLLAFSIAIGLTASAQNSAIPLPAPDTTGGKPLMQVLKARHSSRAFSERKLPDQVLSNLLWAAFGVNRPDGHRTAPSAMNWQEIDIYAFTSDGVFLYDAINHSLQPVVKGDFRAKAGKQDFVAAAPLNLVYVADFKRVKSTSPEDASVYTAADCGFIAQNAYLYCASEGLASVVRAWVDHQEVAKLLNLRPEQKVILAQTFGYPK
jgi:SagB-type dehydrogenase family enzyme